MFNMLIADICFAVNDESPALKKRFEPFIRNDLKPDFEISVSKEDIEKEKKMFIKECSLGGIPCKDCCGEAKALCNRLGDDNFKFTAIYRKLGDILYKYDALVFHAGVIGYKGAALAFTAKSGTGKTTHLKLWEKNIPESFILCGDKPIIRLIDGEPIIYATPWQGKEGYGTNSSLPLKAIYILKRNENNICNEIASGTQLEKLLNQFNLPENKAALLATFKIIGKVLEKVKMLEILCNTKNEAAIASLKKYEELINEAETRI